VICKKSHFSITLIIGASCLFKLLLDKIDGGAENAGVENAGVENAGAYRRGGKCRSGKCRSDKVWKAIRKIL